MREICSYGSVGASAGNRRRYPEAGAGVLAGLAQVRQPEGRNRLFSNNWREFARELGLRRAPML